MDHFLFIAWSYAGVAILVVAVIGFVIWDARNVAARLTKLESQGVRRRSAQPNSRTSA